MKRRQSFQKCSQPSGATHQLTSHFPSTPGERGLMLRKYSPSLQSLGSAHLVHASRIFLILQTRRMLLRRRLRFRKRSSLRLVSHSGSFPQTPQARPMRMCCSTVGHVASVVSLKSKSISLVKYIPTNSPVCMRKLNCPSCGYWGKWRRWVYVSTWRILQNFRSIFTKKLRDSSSVFIRMRGRSLI